MKEEQNNLKTKGTDESFIVNKMQEYFEANALVMQEMMAKQNQTIKNTEDMKSSLKRIEQVTNKILDNTIELVLMAETTSKKIDNSTCTMLKAIVEAAEVTAPTTFIIMPHTLGGISNPKEEGDAYDLMNAFMDIEDVGNIAAAASLYSDFTRSTPAVAKKKWFGQGQDAHKTNPKKAQGFMQRMEQQCVSYKESITNNPGLKDTQKAMKEKVEVLKSKFQGEIFYMYLVDEVSIYFIDDRVWNSWLGLELLVIFIL